MVYLPLWKIWKSVGMMTLPIYGKMFQTTNQPWFLEGSDVFVIRRYGQKSLFGIMLAYKVTGAYRVMLQSWSAKVADGCSSCIPVVYGGIPYFCCLTPPLFVGCQTKPSTIHQVASTNEIIEKKLHQVFFCILTESHTKMILGWFLGVLKLQTYRCTVSCKTLL